ncbi:MAG: NTP pyrophosphohydrolases including oxidative damage repair enzymes [uncultured Pseudonocardia sp.]|uniref:NTP pyrophosphohydrolases including oxidative damage repair enzymes n=1 Tax=uncultured Pseudonocardia sp. TaxID=211455 RepID=A0A6J4QLV7_9PSEU|nr:MAG: NTP pyrophosphohydrolases including oxidative damage repair enzymes [uncultured Pseudonocardia sp.]
MTYDLQRFLDAQSATYDQALAELRAGAKRTHWMWFVFPQVAGLGRSGMAQRFAISGLEEARAYLSHPTLGRRLVESARALTALDTADPEQVFGPVDAMKLRSSMTLFAHAAPDEPVFREILDHWFQGTEDEATTGRL